MMQNVLLQMVKKLNKSRKQRKWWQGAVRTMAAVVVFCTTYALILPAITMEAEPVCGLEEHTHEESCFTQQQMVHFLCQPEPQSLVVHSHSELCYDAGGLLICPLAELELHSHLEECYGTEQVQVCVLEEEGSHSHSEACTTVRHLICQLPEEPGHAHEEGCMEQLLICEAPEQESHSHGESCYTSQLICQIPETEGHAHSDTCYQVEEAVCEKPEIQGHTHEEACFAEEQVLTCGKEELVLHIHQPECYDPEDQLLCGLPQTVVHAHEEGCLSVSEETVQLCTLEEHVHTEGCYPMKEEETEASPYLCGIGAHTHVETCYDEAGTVSCTIPEHTHEAPCLVENYDPDADVETRQQWEESIKDVTFTGIWSQDLLAVARSQLGYRESTRNVVLVGEELKGYTRYGAAFEAPYGDWNALYVAFCLQYAEITQDYIPYQDNAADWVQTLEETGLYAAAEGYAPAAGDLVFIDSDGDAEADHVGILHQINEDGSLELLAGDTEENMVGYLTLEEGILGYGILPENPLNKDEYDAADALAAEIAALPGAEELEEAFRILNEQGDKAGYEALRQELADRMDAIGKTYESFNELQKARVGSLELLDTLKELCGGLVWQQHPAMTGDNGAVTGLSETGVTVIPDPSREEGEISLPENTIRNGDWVEYTFTVDTASYYTDIHYGEARVKLELVLPYVQEQAVFDVSAITWLEEPHETVEYRSINGTETICQILTGYKHLKADEENGIVVPGSFTETVTVKLRQLPHGSKLVMLLSAAMEHGTWEGVCEAHLTEEKLTIATEPLNLYAPLSPEEQLLNYNRFLEQLEEIAQLEEAEEAIAALTEQITESFALGALDEEQYADLHEALLTLAGVDLDTIAEPSKGDGWVWMDFEAETYYGEASMVLYSMARMSSVPEETAMPAAVYSSLGLDSGSQIHYAGGENSQDDVIWVSKTIEGTEQENVFDITLQIITKEEVTEIYKEPNMAVVIVMDISNTMTSVFSGETTVTRYDAAMDSAYAFMKSFAEETDGLSKLGYVAFNTHGHEVFPMQECSTLAQAEALNTTMRTETKSIMDNAAKKASNGKYASSHERFTNIQAGLKMAEDMLKDAPNEHKYVIFLSDGFPTTYMTASTSDGYAGYDPYCTSGTNGNDGVFYDRVMGHHCDYGTSYSDTAAIKARQQAVSMKSSGINIFSIGVDVEGQTIWEYHYDSKTRLKTASTVERRETAAYYRSNGYEVGTLHGTFENLTKLTAAQEAAMAQDFKNWLKGTKTSGIGSNFYYNSTDKGDLSEAYDQIFETILEMNAQSAHLDWVATDPMPEMGVHELETMEFIGFWDMYRADPVLAQSLSGASADNSLYNNTATFDTANSTISWDLKDSGYQSVNFGNNKNYMAALRYRVRLQNENTGFVEKQIYDTNDTTFLNYRIIEVVNGVTQISDRKYIEFPIPEVFGYLSELSFLKTDPLGRPLEGARFRLLHDTASCGTCRGDGINQVAVPDYEAVSGPDGMVTFTNIPSGHHYTLIEEEAPANYIKTDNIYKVEISYDALTVVVTDAEGNPLDWDQTVQNETYYTLPETGGMGTSHLAYGGALLFLAAVGLMYSNSRRRIRKGGAHGKR